MLKDVAPRDDADDALVSCSRRADVRQCPRRVDDTRRVFVRPLEDGDQEVSEAEKTFLGRAAVSDGMDERPQSIAAGLRGSVERLQLGTDDVEELVNIRLGWPSLESEHVTQQSKCALVDLTTNILASDRLRPT